MYRSYDSCSAIGLRSKVVSCLSFVLSLVIVVSCLSFVGLAIAIFHNAIKAALSEVVSHLTFTLGIVSLLYATMLSVTICGYCGNSLGSSDPTRLQKCGDITIRMWDISSVSTIVPRESCANATSALVFDALQQIRSIV